MSSAEATEMMKEENSLEEEEERNLRAQGINSIYLHPYHATLKSRGRRRKRRRLSTSNYPSPGQDELMKITRIIITEHMWTNGRELMLQRIKTIIIMKMKSAESLSFRHKKRGHIIISSLLHGCGLLIFMLDGVFPLLPFCPLAIVIFRLAALLFLSHCAEYLQC